MTKRTTKTQRARSPRQRRPENVAIGRRIKQLRNGSPQTNKSIAEACGIGERAVAEWVRGGGISYENAETVAEIFNVRVQWLLTGEGPMDGVGNGEIGQRISSLEDAVHELSGLVRQLVAADLEADVEAATRPRRSSRSAKPSSAPGRATQKS